MTNDIWVLLKLIIYMNHWSVWTGYNNSRNFGIVMEGKSWLVKGSSTNKLRKQIITIRPAAPVLHVPQVGVHTKHEGTKLISCRVMCAALPVVAWRLSDKGTRRIPAKARHDCITKARGCILSSCVCNSTWHSLETTWDMRQIPVEKRQDYVTKARG